MKILLLLDKAFKKTWPFRANPAIFGKWLSRSLMKFGTLCEFHVKTINKTKISAFCDRWLSSKRPLNCDLEVKIWFDVFF